MLVAMSELLLRPLDFVELGEAVKTLLGLMAVCCARMFGLALIFAPFGEDAIKGVVRNGMVLMMGFYIAWGQPLRVINDLDTFQLFLVIVKEGILGLMLGFACSVVFWVAEAVGALIDNQAGFNNVQQSNPMSGAESTPLGNVMGQLGHACFWMLGGITVLIGLLFESYQWWPLTRMTPDWSRILVEFTQSQVAQLMRMTLVLAAPAMLVLVLIDLGFGLIGKAAEKLEPNSLAQPIKGVVGMLMVALLIGLFFHEARPMLTLLHLQQEIGAWIKSAGVAR
jgi:type III secretion protein T